MLSTIRCELRELRKDIVNYDYCLLKLEKGFKMDRYLPLSVLKQREAPAVELCGYLNNKTEYHQYESSNKGEAIISTVNNSGLYNLDT